MVRCGGWVFGGDGVEEENEPNNDEFARLWWWGEKTYEDMKRW